MVATVTSVRMSNRSFHANFIEILECAFCRATETCRIIRRDFTWRKGTHALKGHDFSRAENMLTKSRALAPEGPRG
jgi:hypothetical protein